MRRNQKGVSLVGKRLSQDVTKAYVLLYIACNPDTEFVGIRKYIFSTLNLTTRKPIDIQLDVLVNDEIITRTAKPKGEKGYYLNCYTVNSTFNAFKTAYDLLNKQGLTAEYIASKYYQEYINTNDFLTKLPLYFFKRNIIDLDDHIQEEDKRQQLITKIEHNPPVFNVYKTPNMDAYPDIGPLDESIIRLNKPIPMTRDIEKTINIKDNVIRAIRKISQGKQDDPIVKAYSSLIQTLKDNTVDQFYSIYAKRFMYQPNGQSQAFDIDKHFKYIKSLIIPEHREQYLIKILARFPPAIDYILNSKYYNQFATKRLLEYYFKPESYEDEDFYIKLFGYNPKLECLYLDNLFQASSIDVSRIAPSIPLLDILRGILMTKYNEGDIEDTDENIKLLKTIFEEWKRE